MKSLSGRIFVLSVSFFLFLPAIVKAEVRLPQIFSSDMVLQQGRENPIWGWADKGEKIVLDFNGKIIKTKAGADGRWKAILPVMNYGNPLTLTIKGKNTLRLENILIGEVWVCSGQSNMEMTVKSCLNAEEEITSSDYPEIRLFTVPKSITQSPKDIKEGNWVKCSPQTIANFSGIGYFFGRYLHKQLKVPVGLIDSSFGGSKIQCWMSEEAAQNDPELIVPYRKMKELEPAKVEAKIRNELASVLYNGMIFPIIPFGIKGVIWYQGESDRGSYEQYQRTFQGLINDWRKQWMQKDFPFLFVSLANYRKPLEEPGESDWAEIREAQTMALKLPNTGMALAIDLGEADNIHPKNKQEVGRRLGLNAMKVAYNKEIVCSGPVFSSVQIDGNFADINFDSMGSSLMVKDPYGYIKGFAVAGSDKKFYWAKAELRKGNVVRVYSEKVNHPVAVRYGWANNPSDLNLFNMEGLPANPFRTDKWKLLDK
jgi:sialate O-acetylesterase